MPLGPGMPLDDARQQEQRWFPYWWSREAVRFLDDLFASDRDFREILTGKQTFVNGPLAQFYTGPSSGATAAARGKDLQLACSRRRSRSSIRRASRPDLEPHKT